MTDLLGHEPPKPRKAATLGEAGYERRPRDFYATPPWVTRALLDAERFEPIVWEPACGDGRMARVIAEAGYTVIASDIHDYGYPGTLIADFLRDGVPLGTPGPIRSILTNPPFDIARQFIVRALEVTRPVRGKVAILQRHEFDAPKINHPLFAPPFAAKLVLPRRPQWIEGVEKASPRFPYAWYLFSWKHEGPPILRYLPDAR